MIQECVSWFQVTEKSAANDLVTETDQEVGNFNFGPDPNRLIDCIDFPFQIHPKQLIDCMASKSQVEKALIGGLREKFPNTR